MNDRFQFRAWYIESELMHFWDYETPEAFFYYMGKDCMDFSKETVFMQCTGLKDKNGKLIYEGDIVDVMYNYIGSTLVKFEDGKYNVSNYNLSRCEIIGNIHENPELLETK